MPRNLTDSPLMKPLVVLALPGMYLFYKYNQYKQQQQEQCRRKVTERELAHLNHKIDKLLTKLEENEPELATSQEDECVICVNAKATMQTSPCGHRVVCRKCFVKTIQMAVSQRLLPLRCVICRAKILRLKQSSGRFWLPTSASQYSMRSPWGRSSWGHASGSLSARSVPPSASQYSMGARSVSTSASMYSMTSGSSSLSGVSSVSSATNPSTISKSSSNSSHASSVRQSAAVRQPTGSLRKSQHYSMKMRIQEYHEPRMADDIERPRLPPIAEFQREYRIGRERAGSSSTRIRCAQNILTQLEKTPPIPENDITPRSQVKQPMPSISRVDSRRKSCSAEPTPRSSREKSVDSTNRARSSKREELVEKIEVKSRQETVKSEKEERKVAKAAKKEAKKEAKREAKREAKEKKEAKEREKREAKEREAREKKERKEAKKESKLEGREKLLDNVS